MKSTAKKTDIFAQQNDFFVPGHFLAQSLVNGI
jgi:hypothetical protein